MVKYIYFEDSWNEEKTENRPGEILNGRVVPTGKTSDDTKKPRR